MSKEASVVPGAPGEELNLLAAPHLLAGIFKVILDKEALPPEQEDHFVSHLSVCSDCRIALLVLLSVAREADRAMGCEDGEAESLLAHFAHIHCALNSVANESIAAYSETIHAVGHEAADKDSRFTSLAAHVAICSDCQWCRDDILAFLRQDEV